MQVEAQLIQRTQGLSSSSGADVQLGEGDDHLKSRSARIAAEFKSWARLFSTKFIDRTWIGILMMFFQRECRVNYPPPHPNTLRPHPGIARVSWCRCLPHTRIPYVYPRLVSHAPTHCPIFSDAPLLNSTLSHGVFFSF